MRGVLVLVLVIVAVVLVIVLSGGGTENGTGYPPYPCGQYNDCP